MMFLRRSWLRRTLRLSAASIVAGLAVTAPFSRASATADTFARVTNPSGGTIVAGTLGDTTLPQATARLMRRVHDEFGKRPTIVQAAQNASAHSATLLFTEERGGTSYTGMAIVTADPGEQAAGAALFDVSTRFGKTVSSLMRRLNAMTAPAHRASGSIKASEDAAPARPLITHQFSDGTGSIGVPAGWTLGVGGGGSAAVLGPGGVLVEYNMVVPAADPTSPRTEMLMRFQGPAQRQAFLTRNAMLPYSGDAVKTWDSIYARLAEQAGKTGPTFHISRSVRNGNVTAIDGTYSYGSGSGGRFSAFVFLTPPDPNGLWGMHNMSVWVPAPLLAKDAATAEAVLASVRINFDAVGHENDAIRSIYHQKFETQLGIARAETAARTARVDEAMANDRAAQENMHKQAVSMENYSLDRAVVVDTRNGEHTTVDSGFADELARDNANYQKVPAQDLLRGVDY